MPHRNRIVAMAVAISATLLASGCSAAVAGPSLAASEVAKSDFSANDLMFAAMMIPHHEQAVELSELAASRSENPDVLALAEQIRAAQAPEIDQMRVWLGLGPSDSVPDMAGHNHGSMGGMLSTEQLAELKAASGAEFDRLFLSGMIAHHEGAIDMVDMIRSSSNNEARELGEAIVSSQTAEIAQMRQLLAALD